MLTPIEIGELFCTITNGSFFRGHIKPTEASKD